MEEAEKKSVETMFTELEDTISKLGKEDISLEEAFNLYENGMKLVASCQSEIDTVEKKVLMLNGGEAHEFS